MAANVYFRTSGLPDGNAVNVSWHLNNLTGLHEGWQNFTSPGPSNPVGLVILNNFFFSYPPVISSGGDLYFFSGSNPQSPVVMGATAVNVTGTYALSCIEPAITDQPVNATTCAGVPVTFFVRTTGTTSSFQWRHDSVNITGAILQSYTIASPGPADAGSYDVLVWNSCGTVTSETANLTVNTPPTITVQPTDVTADVFTAASFSVSADGAGMLSYQWRHDGTNITGATGTEYDITTVHGTDEGLYDVLVGNGCGATYSDPATLTVNRAATTTNLTSSWNPSVYYLPTGFTSHVGSAAGNPTGTVLFFDEKNYLGEGTLNETGWTNFTATSSFIVGTHTINASYLGDEDFLPSFAEVTQTVNQYPPPVITGISPTKGHRGKTVLIKITGTGFLFDSTVNLSRGSTSIYGEWVKIRPKTWTARFRIWGKSPKGSYNLSVTNIDGQSATAANLFQVKQK